MVFKFCAEFGRRKLRSVFRLMARVRSEVPFQCLGLFLASSTLLAVSHAPLPRQVSAECSANCTIELRRVAKLTDSGHPDILPEIGIRVVPYGDGYLTRSRDGRRLVAFNASGRIATVFDGPADRPFRLITNVLSRPDGTVQVYDFLSKSLTTLDRDLKIQGVQAFPFAPAVLVDDSRGYVHAQQIATPDLAGQPIHLLGSDGAIVRSFGNESGKYRADMSLSYDRVLAMSSDRMLWIAPPGAYRLEKWNPATGRKVSEITVRSTWFKESVRLASPGERPVPLIDALWEHGGYLWVLFRDADSNWRKPEVLKEHELHWREFDSTYDSILEAVSIKSGLVVASRRFDRPLQGGPTAFLLSSYSQTSSGAGEIEVSTSRLVRKEKTQ